DVIVEVMGGVEPAKTYITQAMDTGKHVVTANKELMARHGHDLIKKAQEKGLDLLYEASVCGGIPVIQALNNQLAGNRVRALMGIVNGTTNYILTRMHAGRASYDCALEEAQEKGYAEADPTADVENFDAQSKLAILASLAFSCHVRPDDVHREGISWITPREIEFAEMLGYRIKSLAIASESNGSIEVRVHPAMVPLSNPVSKVDGANNAVLLDGDFVGDVMLFGPGAGKEATASAVVGDLIEICRNHHSGASRRVDISSSAEVAFKSRSDFSSRYYLRVTSEDRPKALGQIAMAFGDNNVSLSALEMHELSDNKSELVFLTHKANEGDFVRALADFAKLPMIEEVNAWLRVTE
ncbi:MAG: homoserine dehydrogenase, partial [Armatimonadota bacterium]|nr:homoserine dehydrogenase [Armatimonadota bacterium]